MATPIVDVGIPCSQVQSPSWWAEVIPNIFLEEDFGIKINRLYTVRSAMPDHQKNNIISDNPFNASKKRMELTDMNRVSIVAQFMTSEADWLWFIDDDTVPPVGALSSLLRLGRNFAAGLYFNPNPPNNPIAYILREDGLYHTLDTYAKGAVTEVDSVGMGCTVIHKSVFQKIMDNHVVLQKTNGSLIPIHKDSFINKSMKGWEKRPSRHVIDGWLCERVIPVEDSADENRAWPFYCMEYGRTEDHFFCELAGSVGIKPWIDTNIVCKHIKEREITEADHKEAFLKRYYDKNFNS